MWQRRADTERQGATCHARIRSLEATSCEGSAIATRPDSISKGVPMIRYDTTRMICQMCEGRQAVIVPRQRTKCRNTKVDRVLCEAPQHERCPATYDLAPDGETRGARARHASNSSASSWPSSVRLPFLPPRHHTRGRSNGREVTRLMSPDVQATKSPRCDSRTD